MGKRYVEVATKAPSPSFWFPNLASRTGSHLPHLQVNHLDSLAMSCPNQVVVPGRVKVAVELDASLLSGSRLRHQELNDGLVIAFPPACHTFGKSATPRILRLDSSSVLPSPQRPNARSNGCEDWPPNDLLNRALARSTLWKRQRTPAYRVWNARPTPIVATPRSEAH